MSLSRYVYYKTECTIRSYDTRRKVNDSDKPLQYNKNYVGHNIAPCGTPCLLF